MACAGERAPDAGDRANRRYDDLRARTQLNLRYETCADGAPFGATCGLLLERAAEELAELWPLHAREKEQRSAPSARDVLVKEPS